MGWGRCLFMGDGWRCLGMGVCECLGTWVKGFRGWVCVNIGGHGWNGMGQVSVYGWWVKGSEMGVCECLGPLVKWIYVLKGFGEWVLVLRHWLMLPPLTCTPPLPPPPPTHVYFAILIDLNHDTEPQHEPRHLNHDIWTTTWTTTVEPRRTTMKSRLLPGVVSVAGGSQWRECTVLENLPGYRLRKCPEIAVLGLILVSQVTCLVAGFKKSAEIAILRLIRASQENWRFSL